MITSAYGVASGSAGELPITLSSGISRDSVVFLMAYRLEWHRRKPQSGITLSTVTRLAQNPALLRTDPQ